MKFSLFSERHVLRLLAVLIRQGAHTKKTRERKMFFLYLGVIRLAARRGIVVAVVVGCSSRSWRALKCQMYKNKMASSI